MTSTNCVKSFLSPQATSVAHSHSHARQCVRSRRRESWRGCRSPKTRLFVRSDNGMSERKSSEKRYQNAFTIRCRRLNRFCFNAFFRRIESGPAFAANEKIRVVHSFYEFNVIFIGRKVRVQYIEWLNRHRALGTDALLRLRYFDSMTYTSLFEVIHSICSYEAITCWCVYSKCASHWTRNELQYK